MLDGVVAACLQDVEEAREVARQVGIGVADGVAHASLCCEVDDLVELLLCKEVVNSLFVLQSHPDKPQGRELAALVLVLPLEVLAVRYDTQFC